MMEVKACEIRSKELSACLERLEIATQTYSHPAVFTVQESYAIQEHIPGVHCKTLFLKDQSGEYVLAIAEQDRRIDLKQVAKSLGLKRMSFAKAEEVWDLLGVKPGSVTPFALLNEKSGRVRVALDRSLLEASSLNYHPLTNTQTTTIRTSDLLRFIRFFGYRVEYLPFEEEAE